MKTTRTKRAVAAILASFVLVASAGATGAVAVSGTATTATAADVQFTTAQVDRPNISDDAEDGDTGPLWLERVDAFVDGFENVSESDRAAIVAEVEAMKEDGAGVGDVHHALHYLLYQHGYDERAVHEAAFEFALTERFGLADEEAATVVSEAMTMRENGASREEARRYVVGEVREKGDLAVAKKRPGRDVLGRFVGALDLTDDQRGELRTTVVESRRSGDDPRETLTEVRERLVTLGFDDADLRAAFVETRVEGVSERAGLTDAETQIVVDGALDRLEDGADRDEIREHVRDQVTAYADGDATADA